MLLYLFIPTGLDYRNGFFSILFVPFIVLMSINNGYIRKICTRKNAIVLGELSFSIYILQNPIWHWFKHTFLATHLHIIQGEINFYSTSIVLLCVSFLLYTYLEKPARNYIRAFSLQKK